MTKNKNKKNPTTKTKKYKTKKKPKISDHTATCIVCVDQKTGEKCKCEIRDTCYDDLTATTPRKEILHEIQIPVN